MLTDNMILFDEVGLNDDLSILGGSRAHLPTELQSQHFAAGAFVRASGKVISVVVASKPLIDTNEAIDPIPFTGDILYTPRRGA